MVNERGIVLVVVMAITLMVMILGSTAIKMSELGYLAYGSEKRYQIANAAAEYGINIAIKATVDSSSAGWCPSATTGNVSTGGVSAAYSYFAVSAGSRCFIQSTGSFGGAKIVKNVVIPAGIAATAQYGALTMRNGGTLTLGGSAAVVNCSSDCEGPGIMYGGSTTMSVQGGIIDDPATCPNNPKGIYGSPYAVINKDGQHCSVSGKNIVCPSSAQMDDLVPTVFGGTYNGHTVDVTNLTASNMPAAPAVPSVLPACRCTSAVTLQSTTTSCPGVASFAACGGAIGFDSTVTVQGMPANVTNIVSTGNVTISPGWGMTLTNTGIYTTGSANITVEPYSWGLMSLSGSTLSAGGSLTLNKTDVITDGSRLAAGANLTMPYPGVTRINNSEADPPVQIVAGGNIQLWTEYTINKADIVATGANSTITITNDHYDDFVSHSMIVASGDNSNVTISGGGMNSNTVVTKGTFSMNGLNANITDTNIFANAVSLTQTNKDIEGGILYSKTTTSTTGNGNGQVGTSDNPTLLLSGGNLNLGHSGTTNFNGMLFSNGAINYTASGNFNASGAIIGNSTSANNINTTGNQSISFSPTILTSLTNRLGAVMKPYSCSGSASVNRAPYISATKITAY